MTLFIRVVCGLIGLLKVYSKNVYAFYGVFLQTSVQPNVPLGRAHLQISR